ncbi:MAG: 1,4-alpha-glucan branching protein GlgB [Candidatus Omnitrophica bacterium]|nr:1,4-alpha-glucan branching protein GlgB [Candidatus Omnitrophota bacterium]
METLLNNLRCEYSLLTDSDVSLIKAGNHGCLYEKLGSHIVDLGWIKGVYFAVWAPNAHQVTVIGSFNNWNKESNPLKMRQDGTGLWEGFVQGAQKEEMYKYFITSKYNNYTVEKRDPFSFYCEKPPQRASIIWDLEYEWNDAKWMQERSQNNALRSPFSIYEMHFGSWHRFADKQNRYPTYDEMAQGLIRYVKYMGFTHVEFLPLTAHPFYDSWGYQTDGYFSPTARYGSPQDMMFLIDRLHQHGIGVILDWVPSHFPCDQHSLSFFDGTHLYEHSDPRKGYHPDWKSSIFNYGRVEVCDFLISSALFWIDKYHADGLRVDGGASMLYLDYSRNEGAWIPNELGGRENLEAVKFLKKLNNIANQKYPNVQIAVEESTAWPDVSRPIKEGGLGFGMKWNMGWMHDTLRYFSVDPVHRKHHHNELTFSIGYAFTENFLLSLSHDEVVHGKGSLIGRMPGQDWEKFANLRLLFGYMYGHPGKKLIFMGGELGQWSEWNNNKGLDWHLLDHPEHKGVQQWVKDLNHVYKCQPALFEKDFANDGFEWIDFSDWEQSIISFIRKGRFEEDTVLVVYNFTPVVRYNYRIGIPFNGYWREILNSGAKEYGGDGSGNFGGMLAEPVPFHGRKYSLSLTLPPLSALFFKYEKCIQIKKKRIGDKR